MNLLDFVQKSTTFACVTPSLEWVPTQTANSMSGSGTTQELVMNWDLSHLTQASPFWTLPLNSYLPLLLDTSGPAAATGAKPVSNEPIQTGRPRMAGLFL